MRKIVSVTMLTLDGVIQSGGGKQEDPSGGFEYGGWAVPYGDELGIEMLQKQLAEPFDLLLGRKVYEIFAEYWPTQENFIADAFNNAKKYVVSSNSIDLTWDDTTLVTGDVVEKIKELRNQDGPMLQVYGAGSFLQTLLKNDLVDELWLEIIPQTIGTGKRIFEAGTQPASWKLLETHTSTTGCIYVKYARDGALKTAEFE